MTEARLDQVGAMKRPEWLLEAFRRHQAGEAGDEELREAQDRSIRELVARQVACGMTIITDGEHRRRVFMQSYMDSVSGYGPFDYMKSRVPLVSRLRKTGNRPLDEYRFAAPLTDRTVKVTFLSPIRMLEAFDPDSARGIYADADEYRGDVLAISREIVGEVIEAGCRYVSIDAPFYTSFMDPADRSELVKAGVEITRRLESLIQADNAIVDGFPGVTFGIHLCRGGANRPGRYREGGYEAVAEQMFNSLGHDRFLLEFDTERAGGFEPLRFVPKGKIVVLGLVSTKLGEVEDAEALKRRIAEAARIIPLEQLALSAACGFGGSPDAVHQLMTEDDQWRKIEVMRKVVDEVWR